MPTATEITETVQDGIMKVVETSQRLTLEALGAAVSTIDGFLPEMPKVPFAKSMCLRPRRRWTAHSSLQSG